MDPIADMLTRIRNGLLAKKLEVVVPYSHLKFELAKILVHRDYLEKVEKEDNNFGQLRLFLKYENNQPVIRSLKRISKPGRRIYVKSSELPRVLNNLGIAIISTSRGLMTNQEAKKLKLGGEILCEIY